jgi:hypothetical protein
MRPLGQFFGDAAESTLYAAKGRLMPLSLNSPIGSTLIASATAIKTRGLIKIGPRFASSQSRDATLDIVGFDLEHGEASALPLATTPLSYVGRILRWRSCQHAIE